MPKASVTVVAIVTAVGLAGCESMKVPTDPVVCTAIAVSSLNVTVRDAATGARVCDATVIAIQGGERFELMRFPPAPDACAYSGPWERPGTFELRVDRAGYESAAVSGIRVGADECHVIPVAVTVDLRPAG
jgi:hypothetical protein